MRPAYVGVCGITTPAEAQGVSRLWPGVSGRTLAIGILVRGQQTRSGPRRISLADVRPVIASVPTTLTILHVQAPVGAMSELLSEIFDQQGPTNVGIQLNMVWPDPEVVHALVMSRPLQRAILQVGHRALTMASGQLIDYLSRYSGAITDVLLDPSGGMGRPFDPESMEAMLGPIVGAGLPFGIGVAGGLGADSAPVIARLLRLSPTLNLDAEGRLRTPDDRLDLALVENYLGAVVHGEREAKPGSRKCTDPAKT